MKTIPYIIPFLIFLCLSERDGCVRCSDKSKNLQTKKLIHLLSFPKESEEALLSYPTQFDMDQDGYFYICDFQSSSIKKYSSDGQFVKQIGGKGHGPAEFILPSVFSLDPQKNRLVVVDQGNRRIQFLGKNGVYLDSFRVPKSPSAIALANNNIYSVILDPAARDAHLITTLDARGHVVHEFGDRLQLVPGLTPFASNCLVQIFNNQLFVLFRYYPFLRIYSLDGKQLKAVELSELNYADRVPQNYNWDRFTKDNTVTYPFKYLFNAFHVNENGIFIGLYDDRIIIDHYDFDFKLKRRFVYQSNSSTFYLFDFEVRKASNGEIQFYILNSEDYPKMDVFKTRD